MLYAMLYQERHTCRSRAQRMLHISPHFGSVPETATTKRAASLPLASRVGDMPTAVLSLQTFPVTHSLLKGLVSWYHTGGKNIIILLLTSVSTFSSQQEVVPGFVRLGQCERADAGLVRGGLLHTHTQPQGNKPQETKPNKSKNEPLETRITKAGNKTAFRTQKTKTKRKALYLSHLFQVPSPCASSKMPPVAPANAGPGVQIAKAGLASGALEGLHVPGGSKAP